MNAPHLPTLPSLPPRPGTAAGTTPAGALPPPSPFAAPVVAAAAATFAPPAQHVAAAPLPSPTIPPPPPSQTSVRKVHAPIDIAALRRPKRKIRSTLVTTTVVGIFLAGLTTGVVLAWRTIAESSSDSSAATETTIGDTSDTVPSSGAPAGAVTPTAVPLQVAGANWVEYSHTPLTVRIPPAATVTVEGAATKYQSDADRLVVVVGPYTALGGEEQIFRDLVANITATVHGTAGATTPVHSLGTAYQVVIAGSDGTWTHVRGLFLGGMSVIIAGQGDQAEPSAVHVAWMSIGYGGVNANGA